MLLLSERFVKAVLENQKYIAIFSREEKNLDLADFNRISDYRRKFDRKLTALLDEGVANGEFQPIDTNVAALAIGGLVSWAYVWYRPHGRLTLDELSAQMAGMILSPGRRAGGIGKASGTADRGDLQPARTRTGGEESRGPHRPKLSCVIQSDLTPDHDDFALGVFLDHVADTFAAEAGGSNAAIGHLIDAPGARPVDDHAACAHIVRQAQRGID